MSISPWRIPVISLGCTLVAIDQCMNINFMLAAEKAITPLVIAVPIAGIAAAACFPIAGIAWRNKQLMNAFLVFICFVCFAIFSLGTSLDRAGTSLDAKVSEAKAKNLPAHLAQAAHDRAIKALHEAERSVKTECATGRGRKCRDRETELKQARRRVSVTEAKLVKASPPQRENAMAARIAALVPVNEEQVITYFPLALPLGLWLGGIAFIGVGFAPTQKSTLTEKDDTPTVTINLPFHVQIQLWMIEEEQKTGKRPTQRKVAEHFRVSPSTVNRHLKLVS